MVFLKVLLRKINEIKLHSKAKVKIIPIQELISGEQLFRYMVYPIQQIKMFEY